MYSELKHYQEQIQYIKYDFRSWKNKRQNTSKHLNKSEHVEITTLNPKNKWAIKTIEQWIKQFTYHFLILLVVETKIWRISLKISRFQVWNCNLILQEQVLVGQGIRVERKRIAFSLKPMENIYIYKAISHVGPGA